MAENTDLVAAVVKVRQRLHKRFWSNVQQQLELPDTRLRRRISPQRVFDLSSAKFRVSRSRSREKASPGAPIVGATKAAKGVETTNQNVGVQNKSAIEEWQREQSEATSWREKMQVYETVIARLAREVRSLKLQNQNSTLLAQKVKLLEQKLAFQTVHSSHPVEELTSNQPGAGAIGSQPGVPRGRARGQRGTERPRAGGRRRLRSARQCALAALERRHSLLLALVAHAGPSSCACLAMNAAGPADRPGLSDAQGGYNATTREGPSTDCEPTGGELAFKSAKKKGGSQFPRQYSRELDQTPAVDHRRSTDIDFIAEKPSKLVGPQEANEGVGSKDIKIEDVKAEDDLPDIDVSSALLFDFKSSPSLSASPEQPLQSMSRLQSDALQRLLETDLGEDDYDLIPDFEHLQLTPSLIGSPSLFSRFPSSNN